MSTCPDLDLYSVYLDNELPEQYKEALEAHLKECSSCRAKFEKMKSLHNILAEDSASILISDKALEDSFTKLQAKRSYNKYIKKTNRWNELFLRRIVPAMAAALVLALVIPLRLMGKTDASQTVNTQAVSFVPETVHQRIINTDKSLSLKSVALPSSSDSAALKKALYNNNDLTSTLQDQILASIDIFASDIRTDKIQITIDLSNVSGIKSSENETMRLIQIPASFSSEGQK